jgi:molybdenum-dependent DNA-binding transcriptional regulator ModE
MNYAGWKSRRQWRSWTRSKVKREMRRVEKGGVPIKARTLLEAGESELYAAIRMLFGGIKLAREEAEIEYPSSHDISKEELDDILRKLVADGKRITRPSLPSPVYHATKFHYGSVVVARRVFGQPIRLPRRGKKEKEWTAAAIKRELKALHTKALEVTTGEVRKRSPGLLAAIYEHFGSIRKARKKAGVPEPKRRYQKQYKAKEALDELVRLSGERGRPVVRDELPFPLVRALEKHFGSLEDARMKARFVTPKRAKWTKSTIATELQRIHGAGLPIRPDVLKGHGLGSVMSAAEQLYGSLEAAADKADVPTRRSWSKETVLEELGALHAKGVRLTQSGLEEAGQAKLARAAYHYVGGLKRARRLLKIS